jgi:hypothetical protein
MSGRGRQPSLTNNLRPIITDRYSKVTKTVPLRVITALSAASAFLDHWVYADGASISLLTDNEPQLRQNSSRRCVPNLESKRSSRQPTILKRTGEWNATIVRSWLPFGDMCLDAKTTGMSTSQPLPMPIIVGCIPRWACPRSNLL